MLHGRTGRQSLLHWTLLPYKLDRSTSRQVALSTVLIQSEDMLHGRIGTQSQLLSIPLPYRLDRSISRQVALSTGMEGVHT
jgi:hypothetical protein